jgi:hypothetical protein
MPKEPLPFPLAGTPAPTVNRRKGLLVGTDARQPGENSLFSVEIYGNPSVPENEQRILSIHS